MLGMAGFAHSANLYPDQAIYKGQTLSSDDGRYRLVMQGDGNLVYYRTSDWSARWWTSTHANGGHLAVMQGDGNFVVYDAAWRAVWQTRTNGHPGAFIAAQDDGNLVVYQNGQALWDIGADIQVEDPKYQGDAVGRSIESNMPYSALGHIGLYDGAGGVYEVLNDGKTNAVAFNTLENFKQRSYNGYWGGASPKIPEFFGRGCFNDYCGTNSYQTVHARWAMVLRAFQILAIGAEYTYFAGSTKTAYPKTPNSPSEQGRYRCDTYLLDIYKALYLNPTNAQGYYINVLAPENASIWRWLTFTGGDLQSLVTPLTIFEKLKNYKG